VQNPNRTRQLFPLAYQLANDLFWVFSVLKLELMKPLLLMVFDFGHGFLSRIFFQSSPRKNKLSYRNPFRRWRFPWTTLRFLFFKFKNVIFRFIFKVNIFLNILVTVVGSLGVSVTSVFSFSSGSSRLDSNIISFE